MKLWPVFLIGAAFVLLTLWASAPPEKPMPYPVGQPGATPLAYLIPTPLGFVPIYRTPVQTFDHRGCGYRLEPASYRCLHMGAVRAVDTYYSYPTGGR